MSLESSDSFVPGYETKRWVGGEDDEGLRLDVFLTAHTPEVYSRTYVQSLIRDGHVRVDEVVQDRPSHLVSAGNTIEMTVPPPQETTLEPEPIPLDIVYEDDDLLVINKQRDMVVHPAPGHYSGTLVHALLYHCHDDLSSINGMMRPGIVHRLDKDTTGLMVVAKNDTSHLGLSYQLQKRRMSREYRALVYGIPEVEAGRIEARIGRDPDTPFKMGIVTSGGKHAITHFQINQAVGRDHALLDCQLETGRTHQIRVHLAFIDHPVVADPMYAASYPTYGLTGQALHAAKLTFEHPSTQREMTFAAPIPDDMCEVIKALRGSEK